ncbi:rho GTPase-activating protein 4-like isoform X2 [Pieris brassicae]|uniref:rho GTPase-activating protein 4-like isoform X2 n=1 Tax=Pieris brassicae TaxID=7116 RepID=UPI001E6604C9|nr:rho GTPase-activating protein 4-like isoform X2 [Pieris brassicae]
MFQCIVQPRPDWGPPEVANAFPDIRTQLAEQARAVEGRADAAAGVAAELGDYCRRRADLEHEYARALDKLARAAAQRHRDQRHKREQWPLAGAYACWQAALDATRALARDHAALADLYGGPLAARLHRAADDVLRLHRKCRDLVAERQEDIAAALAEAATAGKAHAAAAHDWRAAALKLRHAHTARQALAAADPPRNKKVKALEKELDKRRSRHAEARAKALRARAEYVLSLEAANATLQRYYLDDIADIMLCSETGYEEVVGRAVRCAAAAERARAAALSGAAQALLATAESLDAVGDRQRVVAAHPAAFAPPRPLPYAGESPSRQDAAMKELLDGAAPDEDEAAEALRRELAARLTQLEAAARALRAECREHAKTLDAAEAELVRQMEGPDACWDVTGLFGAAAAPAARPAPADDDEDDAPRKDQEDYYLAKFRSYVSCAGRLARLESKAAAVRERLLGGVSGGGRSPVAGVRRGGRRGQFAAPLDDALPTPLVSCVRVIAGYGLRQQGVFRVSGSQVEMQALRAAFERGEDPLADVRDASDMNSVCGLLKLYLRELRPPLVPPQLRERLVRAAAVPDDAAFAARLREELAALPRPALLVLRYLFAFLAHLAEHSDRNMMDAWNLAICLGPTLLPAWGEGGEQVTAQNLVNELVKRTILLHRDVFPQDIAPHALYVPPEPAHTSPGEADEADGAGAEAAAETEPSDVDDLDDDDEDEEPLAEDDAGCPSEDLAQESRSRSGFAPERIDGGQPRASPASVDDPVSAALAPPGTEARLAESTPDLVLDLPARRRAAGPSPADPPPPASPVPARNTLRVAAKFAELTLTGGSLKPALAAKPALLRRPTPHPARPPPSRPAPPDDAED